MMTLLRTNVLVLLISTYITAGAAQPALAGQQNQSSRQSDEQTYLEGCLTLARTVSNLMGESGEPVDSVEIFRHNMIMACRTHRTRQKAIRFLNTEFLRLSKNEKN